MGGEDSETEEISDLSNPDVTTKYRCAGDIVQKALQVVVAACVEDADILTLCDMGDKLLEEETGKIYNKKVKDRKIEKGIAFPTCIAANELLGSFSPLKGESKTLKGGDVVKIELGCHIDGFIAMAGHTLVVGTETVEDRRADVIMAAWNAVEAALRLMQVGNKNTAVTEVIGKVAAEYNCKPVQGVLSHQFKKHVIDGTRTIANVVIPEEKVEEFEFELNEVYGLDVVMSTGEGKPRETEIRSTVFKRNVEKSYNMKTQKARQFMYEVNRRFPTLPFSLRSIEDELVARVGISEAKRHELLEEYPVLREKDKEFVAMFQFTVLLLPGGTKQITGLPLGPLEKQVVSACSVQDEDLKKLLASSTNPKKKKKKSSAAAKDKATEGREATEEKEES